MGMLEGRVALCAGAGRGVGAEVAKEHGAVGAGKGLGKFNDTDRIEHGFHARIIAEMSAAVPTHRDLQRSFGS